MVQYARQSVRVLPRSNQDTWIAATLCPGSIGERPTANDLDSAGRRNHKRKSTGDTGTPNTTPILLAVKAETGRESSGRPN
ncbi:MAG TPA: hypothetical protein PKK84_02205 [Armatimonadota bacterium]|nr:hypothetical protein [Armatimonadota bacterium]